MTPHPDWAGADLPRHADLGAVRLTPLTMAEVEEDFAVVTASAAVLAGFWGDWPQGLTLDENRVDLAWHDREHTLCRSFSWIVRDSAGQYLGCLYVFPDPGMRGAASVRLWFREGPERDAIARDAGAAIAAWLQARTPAGVKLTWHTSPPLSGV